jgi:hypothetical protein
LRIIPHVVEAEVTLDIGGELPPLIEILGEKALSKRGEGNLV